MSPPASAAERSRPHLVLVGLPGSGKSTIGALVADALGRTFLDFDLEIARREGVPVPEIFAERGESGFRDLEEALTAELQPRGNMVLAPGGGWITRASTVALIRPPARLVYLKVTPATALRRMGAEAAGRPLLRHPDPAGELARLLAGRHGAYGTADLVVEVEDLAPQEVAERVVGWARAVER